MSMDNKFKVGLGGKTALSAALINVAMTRDGVLNMVDQVLLDMGEPMFMIAGQGLNKDSIEQLFGRVTALQIMLEDMLEKQDADSGKDLSDFISNISPDDTPIFSGMGLGISDDDNEQFDEPEDDAPTPFNREAFDALPLQGRGWRSGADLFLEALELAGGIERNMEGMRFPKHWTPIDIEEYTKYKRQREAKGAAFEVREKIAQEIERTKGEQPYVEREPTSLSSAPVDEPVHHKTTRLPSDIADVQRTPRYEMPKFEDRQ